MTEQLDMRYDLRDNTSNKISTEKYYIEYLFLKKKCNNAYLTALKFHLHLRKIILNMDNILIL